MKLKTALSSNMDAMAIQMDCRDKLTSVLADINKSLGFGQIVNAEIEGQLKLWRRRNSKCKA